MSKELKPWDSIDSGDLDSAEQYLSDNPGHAAFFPCDAHKLANISLHCIREVRATRAELASLKAGQGEAVAWRWAWKECREDDGWTYRESPPFDPTTVVVQALYLAPPATGVIVQPELLKEAARIIGIYAPGGGSSEDFCLEELRALLAQSQEVKP